MIQVPDAASIATMRLVRARTGRSVGGSTGTNVWGALLLVAEMLARGERGSVVTLICDGGDRYAGDVLQRRLGRATRASTSRRTRRRSRRSSSAARSPPAGALDLGDHVPDRVDDLGRDLVHPVRLARVGGDLLEQLLLVLVGASPTRSPAPRPRT